MKDDTKRNIVVGGLVIAGAYLLTRPSDDAVGGFGGGGGIPLLTGDAANAAEPDSIINYIIPEIPTAIPVWDTEEPTITTKKATYAPSLIPTYPLEYYTSGGISELSPAATQPQKLKSVMELQHYADPFAYAFSGRKEEATATPKKVVDAATPRDKPLQWGEASVGGFFEFLAPLTQVGKGARGRDIALDGRDVKTAVLATKKVEAQRVSTAREYTRVSTGGREWTGGLTSTTKGKGVHFTTGKKKAGTYKKGIR